MFNPEAAQAFMARTGIGGWLVYDFRGSNPVLAQVLGRRVSSTRRCFFYIPASGDPVLLAHRLDSDAFASSSLRIVHFSSWKELRAELEQILSPATRVAMEYSPGGTVPGLSWVDAGTLDLVRGLGLEVVSSGDIFQIAAAAWDDHGLRSHLSAAKTVEAIKDEAFAFIAATVDRGVTEYDVQELIMTRFAAEGLETEDRPVVAVNQHSGDPHYEPTSRAQSPIARGDWVLIDLWARTPGDLNIFSDITWVGYVGSTPPVKHSEVFSTVKRARDAVLHRLQAAWAQREILQGYQLDRVARDLIEEKGYGDAFVHRTGHSIGPGATLHALGVNLDDFETHDTRSIVPGVGFSVEPGVYLHDFGVRLEINIYMDPRRGPTVTSSIQESILTLA